MTSLIDSINTKREETIAKHYAEASSDLQNQVELNPLQTKFFIYAGCVTSDITKEIARRFNLEGTKTEVRRSGILTSTWYLDVEAELPESLAIKETPATDLASYTLTEDEQKVVESTPVDQN